MAEKKQKHLIEGLPVIPRREVFYKGKELEELDVQAILVIASRSGDR